MAEPTPRQMAEACELAAYRIGQTRPLKLREAEQTTLIIRLRAAAAALKAISQVPQEYTR